MYQRSKNEYKNIFKGWEVQGFEGDFSFGSG